MLIGEVGHWCSSQVLYLEAVLLQLARHWSAYILHLRPNELIAENLFLKRIVKPNSLARADCRLVAEHGSNPVIKLACSFLSFLILN